MAQSFDVFRLHGGKVEAARALFPQARGPWIDLSTGISPWAYPHERIATEAFTRLPDPEALAELEAAAAASFGVSDSADVIATPGSDIALRLIGRLLTSAGVGASTAAGAGVGTDASADMGSGRGVALGPRVAVVRPGYSGHVLMWGDAPVTAISASEIERAAREHDVIVLANPNNPDGRIIPRDRVLAVAEQLAGRSGVLIVDEAFADVRPEHSLCGLLDDARARGVVLLRSFGKFFGLAGVRLGFVVVACSSERRASGTRSLASAIRHAIGDWPVSGPAVAVGTAAYRDLQWQSMQRRRLSSAAGRLDALLIDAGLMIAGGTVLYRLARCPDADAIFKQLAAHGVLARPFSSDSTLLRVGLPADESQWQRLAVALDSRHTQ